MSNALIIIIYNAPAGEQTQKKRNHPAAVAKTERDGNFTLPDDVLSLTIDLRLASANLLWAVGRRAAGAGVPTLIIRMVPRLAPGTFEKFMGTKYRRTFSSNLAESAELRAARVRLKLEIRINLRLRPTPAPPPSGG
ncbi:hypothetical protein EVAR_33385_1 [Eumeta japonica]|uniref:Uncharacterized protein n=1 Tax=Eumeta variegata TaxID=151549 RepID=A0A4C1X2E5_EUMVA|nr:hypothetical protein EVAR_33385_1 [Eumeta japonica]